MNYGEYKKLNFKERAELAKNLILDYFSELMDSYSASKVKSEEVKQQAGCRKELEGLCDNNLKRIFIADNINYGYNELRALMHEMIEAITGDERSFNIDVNEKETRYSFPHKRIDEIVEKIIKSRD